MSAAAVIALILIFTIAHDLVVALLARRQGTQHAPLLDELEATSVVIHTRDGKSLAGMLLAVRPDGFLIENADTLTQDGRISIGTVVVPRANVSFFQRLAGDVQ